MMWKKDEKKLKNFFYKEIEMIDTLIISDVAYFRQQWLNDEKF